jgi:hypothetical protein
MSLLYYVTQQIPVQTSDIFRIALTLRDPGKSKHTYFFVTLAKKLQNTKPWR